MIPILLALFYGLGLLIVIVGTLTLAYYPLALIAELRWHHKPAFLAKPPLVSIVVPAYNEEKVIENCIKSILASDYPRLELVLVDDGSRDRTFGIIRKYMSLPNVIGIHQKNAGKAAALNRGVKETHGELIFFVDADGVFTKRTIPEMLKQFTSFNVGGVCGNDAPVNLDRVQTRLMSIQTHVSTSFVRRALAEINCLPIISGNIGAFRRAALLKTIPPFNQERYYPLDSKWPKNIPGPFLEGFIGEDLELTWRIHRAGYRVSFAPQAVVLAEVPSTLKGLWRQRVRWARGFLQTVRIHRDMFFNFKYGLIGLYLPVNFFNQVISPLLQLSLILFFIFLVISGHSPVVLDLLNLVLWFGLSFTLLSTTFGLLLDRAWKDFKFLYVLPLWIPYSIFMNCVMVWAIVLETRRAPARWNKLERTGVVSRREA